MREVKEAKLNLEKNKMKTEISKRQERAIIKIMNNKLFILFFIVYSFIYNLGINFLKLITGKARLVIE